MESIEIKKELFEICLKFVEGRSQTVQNIIFSNQKALQSETKSSAGDKHETGRAMLQLEMEKASQQLASVDQMKEVMAKIMLKMSSKTAKLGSVVITSQNNYFLAIGAGQIQIHNTEYYAVSPSSPIGKFLLGTKEGEKLIFNGKEIQIKRIF